MSKTLYCIRHGLALHNVLYWHVGTKAYTEYNDTPLLDEGYVKSVGFDVFEVEPLSKDNKYSYSDA